MSSRTKRTPRMRNIGTRMNVSDLNCSAKNQQQDAAKNQGNPRAVEHTICGRPEAHFYKYNVLARPWAPRTRVPSPCMQRNLLAKDELSSFRLFGTSITVRTKNNLSSRPRRPDFLPRRTCHGHVYGFLSSKTVGDLPAQLTSDRKFGEVERSALCLAA